MNEGRAERALDLFARLRLVFLAAAMLAFAGAIGSAADVDAAAKAPSGFSVKPPGGGPTVTVTQAEIQGLPQESHDYKEPGRPDPVPHGGTSLANVVDLAATKSAGGFLPGDVKYLTIKGPTGTVFLSEDEIFNPGAAYKEGFPALVGVDSGKTRFFRPQQTGGRGVVSLSDATIASKAHAGDVLGVSVSSDAQDDKAAEGTQVNFTAEVSGPGAGNATIKWSFVGDGKKVPFGTGKTRNTSFPKAASYVVYADVTGDDDSGGQGSLAFKVKGNKTSCPKSERPCDSGGGNGCGKGNPSDDCNGGSTNGTSGGVGTGGETDGTGTTGDPGITGGTGYPYGGYPSYTPPYTPPATDFPTTPSPGDSSAPPGDLPNPTDIPEALPPGVEEVSGTLISDVSTISGNPAEGAAASQESSAVESAPNTVDLDPADSKTSQKTMSLSVAGVVLLFFAGIGKELRRPRRPVL